MEAEFSRIEIIGSMSKVSAFIEMLSSKHIKEIHKLGISGITVYNAMGCGVQSGSSEYMLDFTEQPLRLLPKSTMIMICETSKVKEVIEFLKKEFYEDDFVITCVSASKYLKRATDSLHNAVDNDLFSTAPNLDSIYQLLDFIHN